MHQTFRRFLNIVTVATIALASIACGGGSEAPVQPPASQPGEAGAVSTPTPRLTDTPAPPTPTDTPRPPPDTPPLPSATRRPPTDPLPPGPTAISLNRRDCDEIRGTSYLSPQERTWFLSNCIAPPAKPVSTQATQACHPSYQGACLNPNASDYDCAGGSGNGPFYTGTVTVVGPDVFGLDRDNDGIGCE